MDAKQVDPSEFRQGQQQQWDSAASGWRKWSELIDWAWSGISERLVHLAGIEPGSRVLDVAAGYGEPALSAATKAGPEGGVVATDISAEMLAFGRERAAAAGLENIEFIESDAISLDFPEASFDAALSAGGSSTNPMERRRRPGSAASSSPGREWRSAPGDRRSGCHSWHFRCGPR